MVLTSESARPHWLATDTGPSPPPSIHSAQHTRENLKLGTQCCLHTITGIYPPDGPISLADSRVHETLLHSYYSVSAILLRVHAHTHTTCTHTHMHIFSHFIHTLPYIHIHTVSYKLCLPCPLLALPLPLKVDLPADADVFKEGNVMRKNIMERPHKKGTALWSPWQLMCAM